MCFEKEGQSRTQAIKLSLDLSGELFVFVIWEKWEKAGWKCRYLWRLVVASLSASIFSMKQDRVMQTLLNIVEAQVQERHPLMVEPIYRITWCFEAAPYRLGVRRTDKWVLIRFKGEKAGLGVKHITTVWIKGNCGG